MSLEVRAQKITAKTPGFPGFFTPMVWWMKMAKKSGGRSLMRTSLRRFPCSAGKIQGNLYYTGGFSNYRSLKPIETAHLAPFSLTKLTGKIDLKTVKNIYTSGNECMKEIIGMAIQRLYEYER